MLLLFKNFQYSSRSNSYTKKDDIGISLIVSILAVERKKFSIFSGFYEKVRITESYF